MRVRHANSSARMCVYAPPLPSFVQIRLMSFEYPESDEPGLSDPFEDGGDVGTEKILARHESSRAAWPTPPRMRMHAWFVCACVCV